MKISNVLALPVSYNDDRNAVVDAGGFNIAEDVYSNCTAIIHVINNHDKLVDAFKYLFENIDSLDNATYSKYENLLTEIGE